MPLEILYQDEYMIAINKPHGLLVHRTKMATDAKDFALQLLRDQISQPVFPAHRLDRKTGGVLLFALTKEMDSLLQQMFAQKKMDKTYLAIVRGYLEDEGKIDYPLTNDAGKSQEAVTSYRLLDKSELEVPFGMFSTSRYSMVELKPETGRMHQLRKHMAHIFHPIIADRTHGCNKQNKLFKEKWNMATMLLHAQTLSFEHPMTKKNIVIKAKVQSEFQRMMGLMSFSIQ